MPPKATTQASKSTKKNDKKSAVPEVKLDDFFTRFLAKKRRNLNKKLTKIETYEKTPSDKLQPDHKEIIESKPDTLEKLEYFETIHKLYIEAYLAKDDDEEGAPAQSPQRQEEPKAAAAPVAVVNHEENNARIAAGLAQLLTASSFFAHTQQREAFAKTHGAALSKKYGANFLEGLGNLWRTLSEHHDAENSARVDQVTKIVENFLNNSTLISPATNTTYQRLHEAVRELGGHPAFLAAVHGKTHHVAVPEESEPATELKTEIKMVKSSRKNSKRSRVQSEVVADVVAHVAEPAPAAPVKVAKPAKEVDPDAPQEDDEWFSAGGRNTRGGRGNGRGRGRGNGRGGRDGPRREDGGNPRPRTERREDRGENTEGGEPRERRPRGGRGTADGERRQFRPEGDRPFRGDGERRGGRGRPRGDGERRPRGDRGTAQNEGANQETN